MIPQKVTDLVKLGQDFTGVTAKIVSLRRSVDYLAKNLKHELVNIQIQFPLGETEIRAKTYGAEVSRENLLGLFSSELIDLENERATIVAKIDVL